MRKVISVIICLCFLFCVKLKAQTQTTATLNVSTVEIEGTWCLTQVVFLNPQNFDPCKMLKPEVYNKLGSDTSFKMIVATFKEGNKFSVNFYDGKKKHRYRSTFYLQQIIEIKPCGKEPHSLTSDIGYNMPKTFKPLTGDVYFSQPGLFILVDDDKQHAYFYLKVENKNKRKKK